MAGRPIPPALSTHTLPPVTIQPGPPGSSRQVVTSGTLKAAAPDWLYLPVTVPPGVARLEVRYDYDHGGSGSGAPGNALDLGLFDERGIDVGAGAGFRGWSGGARSGCTLGAGGATPGYVAGPIGAGTWHVLIAPYAVAPAGMEWTVEVEARFGPDEAPVTQRFPPQVVPGRGPSWYRGDLHVHTVHSDGAWEVDRVIEGARRAGLDFVGTADHNTATAHGALNAVAADGLLLLTGEEVTTRNGHLVAAGVAPGAWFDFRYRPRDRVFPDILAQIEASGGIPMAAHPVAPCRGCAWRFGFRGVAAIEVWNGPWTLDDEAAVQLWEAMLGASLATGDPWIPAAGGSDAHRDPDLIGLPQTVVRAASLSRKDIVQGLRRGRSWIAAGPDIDFALGAEAEARSAGIGERLPVAAGVPVQIEVSVRGVPLGNLRLLGDQGQLISAAIPASGELALQWQTSAAQANYIRAEIRQPGPAGTAQLPPPMAVLSNPIFLGDVQPRLVEDGYRDAV